MFKQWRLGTVLGFPIELNVSFLLLLAVVLLGYGGLLGIAIVGLAFASVLVHELGHAVVARQLGVHVSGIELGFFGGAAKMVQLPRTATHELLIAAAGPAVSLMIGGATLGLAALTGVGLFAMIGWINLVIAGFNLIPALPMDGGRILRALLTRKYDFLRATDLAVDVARWIAGGFVVVGLAFGWTQLVLIAPFLWLMGTRERLLARMMADQYASAQPRRTAGPPEVEVLGRDAWQHRAPGAQARPYAGLGNLGAFGGFDGGAARRFRIVQRGGRLVVELLD
jgi:Zn-dependent protease